MSTAEAQVAHFREKWIVDYYMAISHSLRAFGVHSNLYDGGAIRYPTILGLWLGRELVKHPNGPMRNDIR